ncbi:helix-hairpin-helix domain-containing protein [Bifidobacterium sp. ESL0728]|uniref:ComEA family DNA-binding protein n=1 Tax=Bifidobacterium sp. ESL0728 TaxID=2983220 RepID=UPI0023F71CD4|nr:helix-hairpin-helix domain-containing protein [Bifidobacterium sp. ESL0728]WEV58266.1 helix-hairpin-helix domain-containing protein [Bifidobacterium sp. ESL0728]
MLEGMRIHFDHGTHDESQALTTRLYSSAVPQTESPEIKLRGNGESLDEDLLRVGLPPLPPIERWLVEPEDKLENTLQKPSENVGHTLQIDDFDSVIESTSEEDSKEDSGAKPASRQRTIPRLVFKPAQAVVVILLLAVALCASLTMLVTQAINYNKQQAEASSLSSEVVGGSKVKGFGKAQGNPSKKGGADASASASASGAGQNSDTSGALTSANPSAQSGVTGASTGVSGSNSNLINLNNADSTQLQQIKGVGPVMAQKIIEYRASIGRFTSVDQLLNVSGIGQKTLEKIRGQVTV